MSPPKFLFKKKSGAFRRSVRKEVKYMLGLANQSIAINQKETNSSQEASSSQNSETIASQSGNDEFSDVASTPTIASNFGNYEFSDVASIPIDNFEEERASNCEAEVFACTSKDDITEEFQSKLKEWAFEYKPTQSQLKGLLSVINSTLPYQVPSDPRTLMETPGHVRIMSLGEKEEYWHHGTEKCLRNIFNNYAPDKIPKRIYLNINIDGLPLFNSSRTQFWPILFNIHGLKDIKAQVVGIFCGKGDCFSKSVI